jgi:hypothetical protein
MCLWPTKAQLQIPPSHCSQLSMLETRIFHACDALAHTGPPAGNYFTKIKPSAAPNQLSLTAPACTMRHHHNTSVWEGVRAVKRVWHPKICPLWYKGYFKVKTLEKWQMQKGCSDLSFSSRKLLCERSLLHNRRERNIFITSDKTLRLKEIYTNLLH